MVVKPSFFLAQKALAHISLEIPVEEIFDTIKDIADTVSCKPNGIFHKDPHLFDYFLNLHRRTPLKVAPSCAGAVAHVSSELLVEQASDTIKDIADTVSCKLNGIARDFQCAVNDIARVRHHFFRDTRGGCGSDCFDKDLQHSGLLWCFCTD